MLLIILSDNSFNPISSKLLNSAYSPIKIGCLGFPFVVASYALK